MSHKIFFVSLLFLAACTGGKEKDNSLPADEKGTDISHIVLKELNGQDIDLDLFKGKTVFINVWATWCKPCIIEMPSIERLQKVYENRDVIFLLASNEEVDDIQNYIKKKTYNFHYVYLENMEALKIQALPTTYIFNAEGKLIFSEAGSRKWDDQTNIELITTIMNNHEK